MPTSSASAGAERPTCEHRAHAWVPVHDRRDDARLHGSQIRRARPRRVRAQPQRDGRAGLGTGEGPTRVLDLYARRFGGRLLRPGDFVICADEKSQLQALGRRHPTVPAGPGRPTLVEFEYRRGGTLAYLAAWDVHHARLFDRVEAKTGIEPFGRLVERVMTSEPYRSARRVFWIVDNGSSHAGQASIARMQANWPNARLIHLPIHASWLNQTELFFSIVQRKALTPNDFASLDQLAARLLAF